MEKVIMYDKIGTKIIGEFDIDTSIIFPDEWIFAQSVHTHSHYAYETLYYTENGQWVLKHYSWDQEKIECWYEYVTEDYAKQWLSVMINVRKIEPIPQVLTNQQWIELINTKKDKLVQSMKDAAELSTKSNHICSVHMSYTGHVAILDHIPLYQIEKQPFVSLKVLNDLNYNAISIDLYPYGLEIARYSITSIDYDFQEQINKVIHKLGTQKLRNAWLKNNEGNNDRYLQLQPYEWGWLIADNDNYLQEILQKTAILSAELQLTISVYLTNNAKIAIIPGEDETDNPRYKDLGIYIETFDIPQNEIDNFLNIYDFQEKINYIYDYYHD